MMFRPQFVLTLLCLILAQYTFSKSIKKQSKKHSITKERSHYLLLMGNPVEDGQHHKGLGMILGSKHNEDQKKLNEADAQHSDVNSNGNLAAALQKSSNGYPSDRGYSYTEALFTGTPLLNGRPFTASDRTHNSQRHVSDLKIAQPKGNDQASKSYKGAELLDPSIDKSNDSNRHEGSAQIQKEIHTEEGVTGITVNKNAKEGQYMKTLASKGDENEETHSLNKSPEEETKPSEHGYPAPRPSLDDSLYKSPSENVGNNEEKQARESSHNQNKSEHSVEDMHQVLGTSQTLDNFTNNMGGSGQVAEENKIINLLPLKTKVKSYDEESNLLGSSTFNHGHLINRQADHALEQWQDIFNQNTSTGHTGYGTAQGLKLRQEGSNQHMITGTADSGNTESLQKDESSQKPDVDLQPNGSDQSEKETNSVFQEGSHDTHGSTGSLTSQFKESRDRQTDVSNDAPGRLPAEQNREHPRIPGIKGSIDDSGKLPNGKLNYSIGATSNAPYEIERFINQLRPHKIIESSFDEELAHRIVTEPSYQQDSHEALTKQSNEKPSSVMSYPSQSSSTYREGSNPSDVNTQTQGGSSVQELSAGSETEPLGPVTSGRNEPEMQQDTSNRLSTSAVDHQTALVNNTGSHQEQENSESLERNSEHGTKSHYEPSNNSIRPPGYTSNQGEVYINVSSSYRQEHNPSDFSSTNGQITEGQREKSVQAWSTSSDSTQHGPLGENQKDKTTQQGMSHPSSEGVAYARPNDEGTYTDNKSSYQAHEHMVTLQNNAEHASETNHDSSIESPAQTTNQRESNKEVLPTFYHKEGSDPTQFNPREKSLAKERGSQSFKTSSGGNQKQPDAQTETSDQMIPASGVGTRPINGGMSSQQYAKVLQSSVEQHTGKSYSSGDPLRPTLLGQRGFQVGNPEHANDLSVQDQPKGGNKDQQQTESKSDRFSEGVRNDQQKENDRENKNQTIVYYLKIAKGIPLLNRRPIHDQQGKYKENHVTGSQFPSEVTKGESKTDSDGEMVSEWKWQRRPGPSYRPRPSPSYRPRPSFSPSPSPSPSPSSGGGGGALGGSSVDSNVPQGDSEFEQEGLSTHNKYRKTHGVPEMTLDRELSNQAKGYAQKIANMGSLIHSSPAERGESVGENLAYSCASSGTPLTGESATKMWYDEVCKPGYNFVNGGFSGGTGHFTQVVWKDSVKLGIGQGKATQNGMQCIYVVGRYDIAGNMMGEFQDKVLKGNFNEQYCNNV